MTNHKRSTQKTGLTAAQPHPSGVANVAWMAILAVAAITGSLAPSCVMPFAAFAVALAGTVRLRAALTTMTVIWLANQVVGFTCLGYPWTLNTFAWGVVIGGTALLVTVVASAVIKLFRESRIVNRLGLALLLSFAIYEVTLLVAASFLGGLETFALNIVTRIGVINLVWFIGLIGLNELVAWVCRPWLGIGPRLVRAS